jgi:3-hydroxybutyryl-CoA dehydrogenase
MQRVGVIGAGTMGNGIARVFARRGFHVVLCEVEQRFLDRGLATIRKEPGA